MKLPLKIPAIVFLATTILNPDASAEDTTLPHKFEFTEGAERYYMLAVLDSSDPIQLKGYQVLDAKNKLIQFIDYNADLSQKVPEFIRGELPSAQPVHFEDCNFDGFVDAMFKEDINPRFQSFEIWLWNSKEKRFVIDQQLNDAEINFVDPKTKSLRSGGSGGHGDFGFKTYQYGPTGKLTLISTDFINGRENSEVKTYYIDGKISKVVKTAAPDDYQ